MPKNDWTVSAKVAGVTFTPASEGATCGARVNYGGFSSRPCDRKAVTVVSGSWGGKNGTRCALHAQGTKKAAQNDADRTAEYERRQRATAQKNRVRAAATARLTARGLVLPEYGDLRLTDLADQLDALYPQEG